MNEMNEQHFEFLPNGRKADLQHKDVLIKRSPNLSINDEQSGIGSTCGDQI